MAAELTHESRYALSRAHFFIEKAKECPSDARIDFEAYIEAAIIFARAAVHRLKTEYGRHTDWENWWSSLRGDPAVEFFRTERDWILKEAPPKIGQRLFLADGGDSSQLVYVPAYAREFYYFGEPGTPATDTVENHLTDLEKRLTEAERLFSSVGRAD
jgi:hypothetical protein